MKERLTGSVASRTRDVGLPAMLSVAGVVVAVVIAGSAALETWLGSGSQTSPFAGTTEQEAAASLFEERDIAALKATVEVLEIKVEQLMATNERLGRQVDDLMSELTPVTASIPRRATGSIIDHGVAGATKSDRASVHFPGRQASPISGNDTAGSEPAGSAPSATAVSARATQTYFALRLPAFRSVKELTGGWNGIKRRSGQILVGLEPRAYATRDPQVGVTYRLLAGPIRNAGDAALRCVQLGEIGIPCEPTVFAGQPLAAAVTN